WKDAPGYAHDDEQPRWSAWEAGQIRRSRDHEPPDAQAQGRGAWKDAPGYAHDDEQPRWSAWEAGQIRRSRDHEPPDAQAHGRGAWKDAPGYTRECLLSCLPTSEQKAV
ncbi:hypothetical protein V493_00146, partial [Pseudogymnoascus sp. VKM F-4281 (FW-2241)]